MRILLGSIALLDEGQEPGITSPDYVVFKPVPGRIHSRWLYHWLRSDDGAAFIRTLTRGAVRERMLFRRLAFAEIEVPPFEVQAKFSRAIEFLERVRMAAEAELEAANQLFATYRRAVFCAARAKGWATYRLGDLLARPVKTGISKPTSPSSARRCLTLSAVRDGILDVATAKPVAVSDADADGNWVTPGGFYVVRGNGQLRLVGRGALAPAVINPPVLYPDLLFEVIPDPSRVDPRYLRFVWDTDEVRADIERRARTSAGIFKINQANLVEITFAVPPKLEEQRQIAATLAEEMQGVERLREAAQTQLAHIRSLSAGLLRRAFSEGF